MVFVLPWRQQLQRRPHGKGMHRMAGPGPRMCERTRPPAHSSWLTSFLHTCEGAHLKVLVFAILWEGGLGLCGQQWMPPGKESCCAEGLQHRLLTPCIENVSGWELCHFIRAQRPLRFFIKASETSAGVVCSSSGRALCPAVPHGLQQLTGAIWPLWSMHGAAWWWKGHRMTLETFCELAWYLLKATGASGTFRFLPVLSPMSLPRRAEDRKEKDRESTRKLRKNRKGLKRPWFDVLTMVIQDKSTLVSQVCSDRAGVSLGGFMPDQVSQESATLQPLTHEKWPKKQIPAALTTLLCSSRSTGTKNSLQFLILKKHQKNISRGRRVRYASKSKEQSLTRVWSSGCTIL